MSNVVRNFLSQNVSKIFQELETVFSLNQFDGFYQQNRIKAPVKVYLFNLN